MVKMRRPSCSQHGLFEATCCLMCSCWSPFQTEQRIIYFDLVFGDSEPDRHSRQVILLLFWDIAYFFLFTRNIFKNNCIKSVEAALHKSWGIFKFFIPTAVTGAFFFFSVKAWIIFKPLNSGWEIYFWAAPLLGVHLPPQAYFGIFYSISGPLSSKTLFVQYEKMADTHGNVGRIVLYF